MSSAPRHRLESVSRKPVSFDAPVPLRSRDFDAVSPRLPEPYREAPTPRTPSGDGPHQLPPTDATSTSDSLYLAHS